ncbi:prophage protein [Escherichia coli]|uniref:Prophage protein n=1 Tax=Escherichia coli TaxID=562 RepID=A0A376VIP7_ECOLX|nr:prophage protein [Escherichia coli]
MSLNDALLQWEKEQTEGASDPFAGLENAAFNSVSVSQHNRFGGFFFRPENECGDIT